MCEFSGRSRNIDELRKTFVFFAKSKKATCTKFIPLGLTSADLYRLDPLSYVFVRVCRCLSLSALPLLLLMSICEYVCVSVCVMFLCGCLFLGVCDCVCHGFMFGI